MLFCTINTQVALADFACEKASSERMRNYCFRDTLLNKRSLSIPPHQIDYSLKTEGFDEGLGYPGQVRSTQINTKVSPTLEFSSNLNGGNPNKPLQLGNVKFYGEDNLMAKQGNLAGLNFNIYGRTIVGYGRIFDFSAMGFQKFSLTSSDIVNGFGANACSKNYMGKNRYLDVCLSEQVENKTLQRSQKTEAIIKIEQFKSFNQIHYKYGLTLSNQSFTNYDHNKLSANFESFSKSSNTYGMNFSLGAKVKNTLYDAQSVEVYTIQQVAKKPLTIRAEFTASRNGKILGFDYFTNTRKFSLSYPIFDHIITNVGIERIESNIDYFSSVSPFMSFNFQF